MVEIEKILKGGFAYADETVCVNRENWQELMKYIEKLQEENKKLERYVLRYTEEIEKLTKNSIGVGNSTNKE